MVGCRLPEDLCGLWTADGGYVSHSHDPTFGHAKQLPSPRLCDSSCSDIVVPFRMSRESTAPS